MNALARFRCEATPLPSDAARSNSCVTTGRYPSRSSVFLCGAYTTGRFDEGRAGISLRTGIGRQATCRTGSSESAHQPTRGGVPLGHLGDITTASRPCPALLAGLSWVSQVAAGLRSGPVRSITVRADVTPRRTVAERARCRRAGGSWHRIRRASSTVPYQELSEHAHLRTAVWIRLVIRYAAFR